MVNNLKLVIVTIHNTSRECSFIQPHSGSFKLSRDYHSQANTYSCPLCIIFYCSVTSFLRDNCEHKTIRFINFFLSHCILFQDYIGQCLAENKGLGWNREQILLWKFYNLHILHYEISFTLLLIYLNLLILKISF